MARLHQIQVQYDTGEDRALLRLRTTDEAEMRCWLTRRFISVLWPMLMRMMATHEQIRTQTDKQTKSAVLSFQHESALEQADFQTPYEDRPVSLPLGEAPLLAAKVQTSRSPEGTITLCLLPENGEGIHLALNDTLLHSFSKLIRDAAEVAQWQLDLHFTGPATLLSAPPQSIN